MPSIARMRLLAAALATTLVLVACGSDAETATTDITTTVAADAEPGMDMSEDDHVDGDHEDEHDSDDGHAHAETLDVDPNDPIPTVAIEVTPTDVAGTYNLEVDLTDFTVTPDAVDGEPVANEGHMHLLVDGAKVDRFYETSRQFELEPGEHIVEVELNANDHRPWSVDGARINATQLVEVPGAGSESAADVTIDVMIEGDAVTVEAADRVQIPLGSVVRLEVTSDTTHEVHVHGYDLYLQVGEDTPSFIEFDADVPGRFEIELEDTGTFVTELEVS